MSTIPVHGPEERWRRTVDQRGRPLKLKVGRLLKEFGYPRLEPGVGEAIEARLAQVGLQVRPTLRDATADQVIMLELLSIAPAVAQAPVLTERPFSPAPSQPFERAPERQFERPVEPAHEPAAPAYAAPMRPDGPGEGLEQSVLVRAAVEAERRVRNAYDRAATVAAERIAGLERELAAEREATARARDERDELERRIHVERREAAARLQALAAAERTARGLLESQRTELSNLTQTVRVTTAAIAQTRETLGEVHEQVQQTAADVREALTETVAEAAAAPPEHEGLLERPPVDDDDVPPEQPTAETSAARVEPPDDRDDGRELDGDRFADGYDDEPDHANGRDERVAGRTVAEFFEPAGRPPPRRPSEPERRPGKRSGRARAERLRRKPAFVCAVCGRPGKTRDADELGEAGWRVTGDVALCVTCVADDWKLGDGDPVPFRARG